MSTTVACSEDKQRWRGKERKTASILNLAYCLMIYSFIAKAEYNSFKAWGCLTDSHEVLHSCPCTEKTAVQAINCKISSKVMEFSLRSLEVYTSHGQITNLTQTLSKAVFVTLM